MKTLPNITKSQKLILFFLYKFRFTTILQLQKYFNHKDPHRIKEWLKDLKEKKYISAIMDSKDITKPYIFCLASKARHILEDEGYTEKDYLNRIYKEKTRSILFRSHCLFMVNIYLFFRTQLQKNSTLNFCTQQDLEGFDYLPKEIDAYIELSDGNDTNRFFLELFDEYRDKTGVIRFSTRKYLNYFQDGSWQANTDNSPLPSVLFVMSNERRKAFVSHYGKAKLEKTYEDISLFTTTQDMIKFSKKGQNIWKKV